MSYELTEQSQHDGKPVELFRYHGTYQDFYYTSSQKPVSFQAPDEDAPNTYVPLAMRRSAVSDTTSDDENAEVTVDMPVSTELVAIYGFQIAPPSLELTIFRGHNPGEFIQYWNGQVENISVVRGTATIRVPSKLASALNADFPNVYFQGPCNHNLFDARCKVAFEDWSVTAAIDAIDNKDLTVDDIGTLDGQLLGGDAILPSGERRMIVAQVANVISLNYPFAGAEVGDNVILAAGCDLSHMGDCKTKFDNTVNFGGFPFIPPKNIFSGTIEPGQNVADVACLPPTVVFDGWYWKVRVLWEPDGNAAPGNWGSGPRVRGDLSTSLWASGDLLDIIWSFEDATKDYATMDPAGAKIQIVNQISFGQSGVFRVFFRHWTYDDWLQMTVDNVTIPYDDSLQPDNYVHAIGVFPRGWEINA